MKSNTENKPKVYALDNSSQFYPIMATKDKQSLYRMIAVLEDEVDANTLKEAVNGVMRRFPTFATRLKKGFGWYCLEENSAEVKVFVDDGVLLRPILPEETNGYLFRIIYGKNDVALEVFHGLCDGTGAMIFLFAVLQKYRRLQGVEFANTDGLIDLNAEPSESEIEDAYRRYYRKIKIKDIDLKGLTGGAPLLLSGTVADHFTCDSFTAKYSEISKHAKEMNSTFTAFIAGLLAYTVEKYEKSKKPVVMMVPVNLRKLFPSDNVRNFVTFVRLEFAPRKCTKLEDYVASASEQLKAKTTEDKMAAMISTTVRSEKAIRYIPLWFKEGIAKLLHVFLKSRQTIIFSNVGNLTLPLELKIKRVRFVMNASKTSKVNVGVTSKDGEVVVSFMRSVEETTLQDKFNDELALLGVNVTAI